MGAINLEAIEARRAQIRATYLHSRDKRPTTTARGVHHVAILCSDVERTIQFYQGVLEFPLTEIFENRDYRGSNHFFFDIGNGNALAFFDFPGLDLGPYQELLGGLHHLALSMASDQWERIRAKLDDADIPYHVVGERSLYFSDPDGTRLELNRDRLGEMNGDRVL